MKNYTLVADQCFSEVEETAQLTLAEFLRTRGHKANVCRLNAAETWPETDNLIVMGKIGDGSVAGRLAQKLGIATDKSRLGEEGYLLKTFPNPKKKGCLIILIAGYSGRAVIYGAFALMKRAEENNGIPRNIDLTTRPYFAVREWATHAFQGWCMGFPVSGGAFARSMEEFEDYVNRAIVSAPYYGINSLVLHGRQREGIDVSWFITYEKHPKLKEALEKRYWPFNCAEKTVKRRDCLRRLAQRAHAYGLDLLIWDHELVFPEEILELYPEVRGKGDPICFSKPFIWKFLESKYEELFETVPELDGVVLTFFEVGYNILATKGCRCAKCRSYDRHQIVIDVVKCAHAVCKKYGKKLVAREAGGCSPAEKKKMADFFRRLPPDIICQSKKGTGDFGGRAEPDNPVIEHMQGHPFLTEFSLAVEQMGLNFLPCQIAEDLKKRILFSKKYGVMGLSGRLDYHTHFVPIRENKFQLDHVFDTPNEFNIFAFSELAWNPDKSLDEIWREWAVARYGKKAAPAVIKALGKTEDICHKIFFALDYHTTMYTENFDKFDGIRNIEKGWGGKFIANFDPRRAPLWARFKNPDEKLIRAVIAEKEDAVRLAKQCFYDLQNAKGAAETEKLGLLSRYVEKLWYAARIWREVEEMFLRQSIIRNNRSSRRNERLILENIGRLLLLGYATERRFGEDAYPVISICRGPGIYNFIEQYFNMHHAGACPGAVALWKNIVNLARPHSGLLTTELDIELNNRIKDIRFGGKNMVVRLKNRPGAIKLFCGITVTGDPLSGKKAGRIRLSKTAGEVVSLRVV